MLKLQYFIRLLSSKRPESGMLRRHLIEKYKLNNIDYHCTMCLQNYPISLLDTAHLKPRCKMDISEIKDVNNVEFMCKICHNLYDNGYISVNPNKNITINNDITKYKNLLIINRLDKIYEQYNCHNSNYLIWHYRNIFRK